MPLHKNMELAGHGEEDNKPNNQRCISRKDDMNCGCCYTNVTAINPGSRIFLFHVFLSQSTWTRLYISNVNLQ